MAGINQTFDATQIAPSQSASGLPPGKYLVQITATEIKQTSAGDGGMFCVTYKADVGSIVQRFNLWNKNEQAVKIANGQLSALCHATGIFRINFADEGKALIGGRCMIEVVPQKERPEYTEVGLVLDINGNEPGKPQAAAPGGAWGDNQDVSRQAPAQPQQQPPQGWQGQPQQPEQAPQGQPWAGQQAPQQAPAQGGAVPWQQGQAAQNPPWAK
jgi:hypothetical protein